MLRCNFMESLVSLGCVLHDFQFQPGANKRKRMLPAITGKAPQQSKNVAMNLFFKLC